MMQQAETESVSGESRGPAGCHHTTSIAQKQHQAPNT